MKRASANTETEKMGYKKEGGGINTQISKKCGCGTRASRSESGVLLLLWQLLGRIIVPLALLIKDRRQIPIDRFNKVVTNLLNYYPPLTQSV